MTEPDQFGDAVSGIDLSVDFQRRQERASSVEQFQSPAWALDFGEANVRTRVRGVLRGGWGSFCLALGPGEAIWNGQHARAGSLGLLPPGDEIDGCTSADFAWLTVAVPPVVWERCLALAGRESGPGKLTVLRFPEPLLERLVHRFRGCQGRLAQAADTGEARHAADDAAAVVNDAFTTACEQVSGIDLAPGSLRNRARLVRRAEAWMRDHLGESVQVPDLCLALRVSRRELEYAFRAVFNQSPRDHLAALRLNAIRRALLRGDGGGLIHIAHAHGVTHPGRFAASYRALFGEKPSETRRG
jgi:AraC family ethanolamine operon transcriptional activator